jgi:hypothetical protein
MAGWKDVSLAAQRDLNFLREDGTSFAWKHGVPFAGLLPPRA